MKKSLLFLITVFVASLSVFSQQTFTLQGTIVNFETGYKVSSGTLMLRNESGGSLLLNIKKGKFKTEVPVGEYYTLHYFNQGVVSQKIAVDARMECKEEKVGKLSVEIFRMDSLPGLDYGVFDKTLSIKKYSCASGEWGVDEDYKVKTSLYVEEAIENQKTASRSGTKTKHKEVKYKDEVLVYGVVKNRCNKERITGFVTVTNEKGNSQKYPVTLDDEGFGFYLDYGDLYEVSFESIGFYQSKLVFDTRDVPEVYQVGGQGFDLDMSIVPILEGVDYSVYEKPIGKALYQKEYRAIAFSREYASEVEIEMKKFTNSMDEKRCPAMFETKDK